MAVRKQFEKNLGVLSIQDFELISDKCILVVGLGGLGGHFVEGIVRMGINNIIIVDFDTYDETNLNRQNHSHHDVIGVEKCKVIKNEMLKINNEIKVTALNKRIEDINVSDLPKVDYIVDAVDNVQTKRYLSNIASKLDVPILHGACAGWYGQVGWFLPGSNFIHQLYKTESSGLESTLHNPSFIPLVTSAYMISEFVKFIVNPDKAIVNQLLLIDLFNNTIMETGDSND